jgi:hypothetical protein
LVADLCVLGLWLLVRKARASECYVLWSATAPLLFCLALSVYDVSAFTLRYFVPAHLFLLVGLAVLIWRVPFRLDRTIVAAVALAGFAGIYVDFWRAVDVVHKPGARGAAAFLQQQRRPGEPVIVCMPFFYFPLLHDAPDQTGYYLYSDGHPMPHYYGTAAMTPEDLITEEQLQNLRSRRIWVVDMARGFLGAHWVPTPPNWVEKSRHTFSDVVQLGDLIVIEYDTGGDQDHG